MLGIKRQFSLLIKEYLAYFPCVAVIGPRQCGKTTIVKNGRQNWKFFDLEKTSDYDQIEADPDLFLRLNSDRVIIDEAQLLPDLFQALRVAIDSSRQKTGRFLITGSSSPALLKNISESLAGRIGIIEMSPLMLSEVYPKRNQKSDFFSVFETPDKFTNSFSSLSANRSIADIQKFWFAGGYPEPWTKNSARFYDIWFANYFKTYIERDISRLFPSLNKTRYRKFIEMLAHLSGSILNFSEIARALDVSQPTVKEYFEIAHGTFIWRKIPPYEKNVKKRIVKHPKGQYRDTGLCHYLLRISDLNHLMSHPQFGLSWETMVIEYILNGLACRGIDYAYYYYRTSAGAEIDLILEGKFGLIPVEIKYGSTVKNNVIKNMLDFINTHQLPFGIIINNDEKVRFYRDSVIGIPINFIL